MIESSTRAVSRGSLLPFRRSATGALASAAGAVAPAVGWLALAALTVCLAGCGPLGLESPKDGGSAAAEEREGEDEVALVIEGESVSIADLHEHMQQQFLEELLRQSDDELYTMHEQAIRDLVQRRAIDTAAAEEGITSDELFVKITSQSSGASVQDVTSWYTENQSRLRGARLEDVADRIKEMLDSEAEARTWAEYIAPRVEGLDWQMKIEPPRAQLAATRLIRGPEDAPVTIMTFSDYQCPYCVRSEPVLAEVLERFPEDVRVIHRHFPLDSIHPFARPAAEAAMCADEQGQFWEFHDAIFAEGGRLTTDSFGAIGKSLKLDEAALKQCMAERRYEAFVQADLEAGEAAGVTGTPAFFVNGIAMKGARDADELSRVVEAELARAAN